MSPCDFTSTPALQISLVEAVPAAIGGRPLAEDAGGRHARKHRGNHGEANECRDGCRTYCTGSQPFAFMTGAFSGDPKKLIRARAAAGSLALTATPPKNTDHL